MKKIYLFILLMLPAGLLAQEDLTRKQTGNNEFSIGALNLVAFGALDLAYERVHTPSTSYGVELFILALNRDSEAAADAYSKDFSVTGKYKYYFGEERASGFYVNGLAMISTGEYDVESTGTEEPVATATDRYTDLALGFGVGGKFMARQGFFADIGAGIGRNLLNDDSPTIIGQFTVNLGFRF